MSVKVMGMVFDLYPVGGGEMLLALSLADFSDDLGRRIFPSVRLLAKKTRQSERSVQYQLRKMEKDGFISLVSKKDEGRVKGGGYLSREYKINLPYFKQCALENQLRGAEVAPLENAVSGAEIAPLKDQVEGEENALINDGISGAKVAPLETQGCKLAQLGVQTGVVRGATAVAPNPPQIHPLLKTPTTSAAGKIAQNLEGGVVVKTDFIFSEKITTSQQTEIFNQLNILQISQEQWQILLDELSGALLVKEIPNPIGYIRGMAIHMKRGFFTPGLSVKVVEHRAKRYAEEQRKAQQSLLEKESMKDPAPLTDVQIAKLPLSLRTRLEKKLNQVQSSQSSKTPVQPELALS